MKELFRNIVYYQLDTESMPKEYINVQAYTGKYLNYPKSINVGLSNAVELFHITKIMIFIMLLMMPSILLKFLKNLFRKDKN